MPARNDFAAGEFCWLDLSAHDFDAAAGWYGELLGWSCMKMPMGPDQPPYAFMMQGEHAICGLGQMSDEMKAQGIPPVWNSYIATDDCAATEARVKECGGTVTVPTMEVPGHGHLAFFLDPEGASFAAWQSANPGCGPKVLVGEPGGLCWNELMTRDVGKAKDFYGSLVGWDFAQMPMGEFEYTMVKNDDKDAAGMMPMAGPQWEGIPAHWMVYFSVADCDEIGGKAQSTGGQVVVPTTQIMVGKFSVLRDPQGGTFSIIALDPQNG